MEENDKLFIFFLLHLAVQHHSEEEIKNELVMQLGKRLGICTYYKMGKKMWVGDRVNVALCACQHQLCLLVALGVIWLFTIQQAKNKNKKLLRCFLPICN